MLQWRTKISLPVRRRLLATLQWLASQLHRLSQTMFLFEELQPEWLAVSQPTLPRMAQKPGRVIPARLLLGAYLVLSRTAVGAAIGVVIMITLLAGSYVTIWLSGSAQFGYLGPEIGLLVGAGVAVGTLLADVLRQQLEQMRAQVPISTWYTLLIIVAIGLTTAVIAWPFSGLSDALLLGLSNAFFSGVFLGLRDSQRTLLREIQVVEKLRFSPRKALTSFIPVLVLGMAVGYFMGALRMSIQGELAGEYLSPVAGFFRALLWGMLAQQVGLAIPMALIVGFFGASTFGLLGGLTGGALETRNRPNQGIHSSLRSALFTGSLIAVTQGVFWGFIVLWFSWYVPALIAAIVFGLLPGCLAALWHGGIDVIRHYVLRLLLVVQRYWPQQVVSYLDLAADNLLLRRVGGGYIFVHLSLLEHIAALTSEEIEVLARSEHAAQVNRLPYANNQLSHRAGSALRDARHIAD
jgi:hypothetical protein